MMLHQQKEMKMIKTQILSWKAIKKPKGAKQKINSNILAQLTRDIASSALKRDRENITDQKLSVEYTLR